MTGCKLISGLPEISLSKTQVGQGRLVVFETHRFAMLLTMRLYRLQIDFVMPALVAGIHAFADVLPERRGSPGQAR
jgi:hypothetical protein